MKRIFLFFLFFLSFFVLVAEEEVDELGNLEVQEKEDEEYADSLAESDMDSDEDVDTDFNFGEVNDEKSQFSVRVGGSLFIGLHPFFVDFSAPASIRPSSLVWGELHLTASAPLTHAYISLLLNDQTLPFDLGNRYETNQTYKTPRWIDEAFLQVIMSAVYVSGGLKKITWGRADYFSVLDVVNPKDKTQIYSPHEMSKLSIPMFQCAFYAPSDIKIEAVFLPLFEPNLFAIEGVWERQAVSLARTFINDADNTSLTALLNNKELATLRYAHGGARLTATLAHSHDIGLQYFYGYQKEPLIKKTGDTFNSDYVPLHIIGLDYGTNIGPVNIKMELASNIGGYDVGANSNIAWNVGCEFSLPHGFSLNILLKEDIWLSKANEDVFYAFVRDKNQTHTTSLIGLSQRILRGAVEWRLIFIASFESADFAIIPSFHAIFGTIIFDANIGLFLGKDDVGIYGQYKKNNYLKISLGYEF